MGGSRSTFQIVKKSYNLFFTDDAKVDVRVGCKWYNEQREGLEEEFLDDLFIVIDRIKRHP